MRHLAIPLLILLACAGCAGPNISKADDGKTAVTHLLECIDKMCDHDTKRADAMLNAIEYKKLAENDRHYFDLLTIKSRDKKYQTHMSDSLVLDVVNYYSKHKEIKIERIHNSR